MKKIIIVLFFLLSSFSAFSFTDNDLESLELAAKKGEVKAQHDLAVMYSNNKDYKLAFKWFKEAAQQGDVDSQSQLATLYDFGEGVIKDFKQAAKWYEKAAKQGHSYCQNNLGEMYLSGEGVIKSCFNAAYWFDKAAQQNFEHSQFELGKLYEVGCGVPRDITLAIYWFNKAAEQGYSLAQSYLGHLYFQGAGVPQNYIKSYVWFSLASVSAYKADLISDITASTNNRDVVAKKLTSEHLAYAQELVAKIQEKIDNSQLSNSSENKTQKGENNTGSLPTGSGTGFLITSDGYILTCNHVIDGAKSVQIKIVGQKYNAEVISKDQNNDLALLKISGLFQPLAFSSTPAAKIGQDLFVLGYPRPNLQGEGIKLTKGSISSLAGIKDDTRMYQTSAPVQPGNSGGPLLDMEGNVIGVVVAILDEEIALNTSGSLPQNVNYAIKGTYAKSFLQKLPHISKNLPSPVKDNSFDKAVDMAQKAVVMILTYE